MKHRYLPRLVGFLIVALAVLAVQRAGAAEVLDDNARLNAMFAQFLHDADGEVCKNPSVYDIIMDKAHWKMSATIVCGDPGQRYERDVYWDHGRVDAQPVSH